MSLYADLLPDDVDVLKALLVAAQAELGQRDLLIERLRMQLAKLRRMQFGASSERLARQADQLKPRLEEVKADVPAVAAPAPAKVRDAARPFRQPLPDHLPREDVLHEPACACPDCGGALRKIGSDVTE